MTVIRFGLTSTVHSCRHVCASHVDMLKIVLVLRKKKKTNFRYHTSIDYLRKVIDLERGK